MSIAEVYHIIIKTDTLLKSHLLLLSENDSITTNEEWQKYLIKEMQETVSQIKESCDYIVNANDVEMARQMISLHKEINSIMSCYKGKFTKNTRLEYSLNLFALKANMRFILNYFKIKGIDINQQIQNPESNKGLETIKSIAPTISKRSKGRPKESLKDKMTDDSQGYKLKRLHLIMNGKKGRDAALVILACIKKGWMQKPTYKQVEEEFKNIGSQQGFTKYLNTKMFSEDEIEGIMRALEKD